MKHILLVLLLGSLWSCGKSSSSGQDERSQYQVTADAYLELMNGHRNSLGLSGLSSLSFVQEVAEEHNRLMAEGNRSFGHSGFSARCAGLRAQLGVVRCGEIVARGQSGPEEVLKAWLNSADHRRTIENEAWSHTGVAHIRDFNGMSYWTQMFVSFQ